jgi:G3E family GTPase
MKSVALTIPGDVDPDKFMPWVNEVAQTEGQNLLRWKGILAFKGEPRRFVFQGVHMILDGDLTREWRPDETRTSKLVFIGKDLDEAKLRAGFVATAA